MLRSLLPSPLASLLALAPLAAQDWQRQLLGTVPPAAYGVRMAYDAGRAELVLFGGLSALSSWPPPIAWDQTWTFGNGAWTQRAPAQSPPPRAHHAMAYVDSMNAVVLFGGIDGDGSPLRDVWWFDGTTWHTIYYSGGPASRVFPAAAGGSVLTIFGGCGAPLSSPSAYHGDTWTWTATAGWTQIATTGPSPRRASAMGWVRLAGSGTSGPQQRIVLHGGRSATVSNLGDTWLLQGNTWVQVPNAGGPAREEHGLAQDPVSGHAFSCSGHYAPNTPAGFANDLWRFDGARWREVPTATRPVHTIGAAVAMDPVRNRVVLFGGATNSGGGSDQHWEYTPPVTTAAFGPNCLPGGSYYAVRLAARGTPWGGGFHVAAGSVATLAGFVVGFGNTAWNGVPLPLPLGVLGMPQCDLLVEPAWTAIAPMQQVLGGVWAEFQIAVPDVPALYGVDLYTQALALGPATFAAASRGWHVQIW